MQIIRYRTKISGLELYVNQLDGMVYVTQQGLAIISQEDDRVIHRWIVKYHVTPVVDNSVSLFSEDDILEVLYLHNTFLLKQCAKLGLRPYLYSLVV